MNERKLTELSDQELLEEAKKSKSSSVIHAVMIGFLVGIVLYSIFRNGFGVFALIPLFFAWKLTKSAKHDSKELEVVLRERNLKQ